jgi:hypothetical protein
MILLLAALPLPVFAASIQTLTLDHHAQTDLELTVYNNFALVRDTRQVVLPRGKLNLEFKEVAQTIEPSSVSVSSSGSGEIDVLEQSYRYDLLNRQSLLETYIGRKLKYSRTVLQGETYEKVLREGILLSTNPEIVDFGDEIEISPEGVISLPDVPDGLTLNPTLVWQLENSRTGERSLATSYLAGAIKWHADYVLNLDRAAGTLDLTSWATVRNDSGTVFENARIRLVAGNVNKAEASQPKAVYAASDMRLATAEAAPIGNQATGAYQAFNLPNPTTLLNHEAKQLKFVAATGVAFTEVYRLRSQVVTYPRAEPENAAVNYEIQFANEEANGLGIPLAAGVARAYHAMDNNIDLLGESRLQSTPAGQDVTLQLGQAFDLTVERLQTDFVRLSERSFEVRYEIKLSNARQQPANVLVEELMHGDWQIEESSQAMTRQGRVASTVVKVPAKGSAKLSYKVRMKM